MRIDALGIEAFIAVARHRSFRKAADELHITQTALSRRLKNLEDFLGVRLLERTTRSVALSGIGQDFLPQAERLMTELTLALVEIRETGKALRGDVTIACVPTVGVQYLPSIIRTYAARHPDNRIRILDHASANVADAVLRREAEFGISITGRHHDDLVTTPLLRDRFVLICREDHPLARHRRRRWDQLEPHPLIFAGQVSGNRPLLDHALAERGPGPRAHYEVQRSSTAVGLVAQGIAAAVVPRLAMQDGAYPGIRIIALTDPVVSRTLVLVMRRAGVLSPAARALYELIRERR
jgi:DNA-binding transcriptional LysR family regulator